MGNNNQKEGQPGAEKILPLYTRQQVALHKTASDGWVIYREDVLDVTKFLSEHPGGEEVIAPFLGSSIEKAFDDQRHSEMALKEMRQLIVGKLQEEEEEV
eukprot:TRINITY_DN2539_c0_g1_i1.p3 TRINITY_DN2539_c0_g1~~TRINITY_DN2539_c0_g1_i1.p3  ORF type:complete len:100 (-),score=32.46 TRINITY_DN2539_c0_g1_i1:1339-1638(-)